MQTASATIHHHEYESYCFKSRILYTGSQRTYISSSVCRKLDLRQENIVIKTFGNNSIEKSRQLDVVRLNVKNKGNDDCVTIEDL